MAAYSRRENGGVNPAATKAGVRPVFRSAVTGRRFCSPRLVAAKLRTGDQSPAAKSGSRGAPRGCPEVGHSDEGGQARGLPLQDTWFAAAPAVRAPGLDGHGKAAPYAGPGEGLRRRAMRPPPRCLLLVRPSLDDVRGRKQSALLGLLRRRFVAASKVSALRSQRPQGGK